MQTRVEKGRWISHTASSDGMCRCDFFTNYGLPCQHIFHSDYVSRVSVPGLPLERQRDGYVLNEERWNEYAEMFQSRGFEIYASSRKEQERDVELPESERQRQIKARASQTKFVQEQQLPLRQMLEQLRATMFALGEKLVSRSIAMDEIDRDREVYQNWCQQVIDANQHFIHTVDLFTDNASRGGEESGSAGEGPASVGNSGRRSSVVRTGSVVDGEDLNRNSVISLDEDVEVGGFDYDEGKSLSEIESDVRWLDIEGREEEIGDESDWSLEDIEDISLFSI